jgi:16S rRNA (guanine(966)-N(2))-methyltransferase RsmD
MRIVAGQYRSRKLKSPGRLRLRPTSDRLRETLFDILGPTVEDSLFVDVYAGTGAVGIEALSRGAREVIFIEQQPAALALIRKNLEHLSVTVGAQVLAMDALRGLEVLASRHALADFVFVDPPYKEAEEYERVLDFLDSSHLLAPAGRIIVEHSRRTELPEWLTRLERSRIVEQGDAALSFYRLAMAA